MQLIRWALVLALMAAAMSAPRTALAAVTSKGAVSSSSTPAAGGGSGNSLEAAAAKASDTGRKIAFSLIGLAFAIAAIVMSFKRDFKEAVGVFAIGIVAVLLASPAGIGVLQDTVKLLFG